MAEPLADLRADVRAEVTALAALPIEELSGMAVAAGQGFSQAVADLVPDAGVRRELLDRVGRVVNLYGAQLLKARGWLLAANSALEAAQQTIELLRKGR